MLALPAGLSRNGKMALEAAMGIQAGNEVRATLPSHMKTAMRRVRQCALTIEE